MTRFLVVVLLAIETLFAAGAMAGPRRAPVHGFDALPPPEVGGCYYYRGRQWCGRYCYTEINGKRYCQRWKRDAHPQGAIDFFVPDETLK